jgi:predicted dehydrogenase
MNATDKRCRWGILGPGNIAESFATAASQLPQAQLRAVASRNPARAEAFARRFAMPVHYGNYEALANDPAVDAVYIATPHAFHQEHTQLCLNAGKAVLCEKPLALSQIQARSMIDTARRRRTFLMEAMWTRFLPATRKALDLLQAGEIGELKYLRADFGTLFKFDPSSRIYDLKLGGGSLLDVGVYPLFLALLLFGRPDEVKAFARLCSTGADVSTNALLFYKQGRIANILSSVEANTPLTAEIIGSEGTLTLDRPWYKTQSLTLSPNSCPSQTFAEPYEGNGFQFEIQEVMNCLAQNRLESALMPLDLSLSMAQVSDEIRAQCGILYE